MHRWLTLNLFLWLLDLLRYLYWPTQFWIVFQLPLLRPISLSLFHPQRFCPWFNHSCLLDWLAPISRSFSSIHSLDHSVLGFHCQLRLVNWVDHLVRLHLKCYFSDFHLKRLHPHSNHYCRLYYYVRHWPIWHTPKVGISRVAQCKAGLTKEECFSEGVFDWPVA